MNTTDAASIFDTGSIIDGKWVLIERIGKGGMGEVHRAHQLNLKRDVALKLISREFLLDLEDNPEEVENLRARFQREVQVMAQVRHPNVLQIFDYGSVKPPDDDQGPPVEYIAMEYIPGNTLRFTMSDEGLEGEDKLIREWIEAHFLPVLDGVEAIHALGIVHRDLKPENILMDGEVPKITDFGLSRSVQMRAVSNSWDVKGTWPYMAPEQFSDFRKAGLTADIYSLGKILFEAITGTMDPKQLPFKAVGLEDPQLQLERALDAVIRKATHEDPPQRYQSAADLRRDIVAALRATEPVNKVEAGDRPPSPVWVRYVWVGVILAVVSVVGMTIYHMSGRSPDAPSTLAPIQSPADEPALSEPSSTVTIDSATWVAPNGRTLQRVDSIESGQVFYADLELVTYHHYVEFLNEVKDRLEVTEGIVKNGETIWAYISDGQAASEPILYNSGRFQLRDAERSPDPMVRVTWEGAQAYAVHYGLQLPSYDQWQTLRRETDISPPLERDLSNPSPDSGHAHMMGASGAMRIGSSGSTAPPGDDASMVFKEWVAISDEGARGGVADWHQSERTTPVRRYPWEGFEDVGFRTVKNAG